MPKESTNISAALIVKDEHEKLDNCLASFADYVDEIVIVANKPASDELKAVVAKFNGKLYERKWNDNFAEARNFSFNKTTKDVIFWCDVDDVVENAQLLPKLAKLITDGELDWVGLEYIYSQDEFGNVLITHYKPRLTRRGTGTWECNVHENFMSTKGVRHANDESVKIVHHIDAEHDERSAKRNLRIQLAEVERDGDSTDPRTFYYLGISLMELKHFEDAIQFFGKHIAKCGWPEEKYFSMHYLSHCYKFLGRLDEAINVALESTKIMPEWANAYFDLGEYYLDKKDYKKAIEWYISGFHKEKPRPSTYFINELDYHLGPMSRLIECYLQTHQFDEAISWATRVRKLLPNDTRAKQIFDLCVEIQKDERFVASFVHIASYIRDKDRLKAVKLFEALPGELGADIRIQEIRKHIVPPKNWEEGSIVFYCAPGTDEWAYPSILTGIGGSEEAVIHLSHQLAKLGYKVTVYCRCGAMAGNYHGVEYVPYYYFNPNDNFDTLVMWRAVNAVDQSFSARRTYLWLHDIVHDNLFNERIIKNVDKFIFLSKWHRNNAPSIPEEKVFYSNNGIDPEQFKELDWGKKKPNSLIWTSSYDRGLLCLMRDIMPLVEKEIPDVTLDVMYGTKNLEIQMEIVPWYKECYDGVTKLFKEKKNVIHHDRISHQQVADLQKQSMIHAYSSEFGETNNISSQKAQAAGCYVITTSQAGATKERVRFGKIIEGNGIYTNKKLQQQYADEVVKFLKNPIQLTKRERQKIMDEFSWEATAASWDEGLLDGRG